MSARRIATRTRTTERWLIGERTNAETRAWAEGVLPEGAREARWVLDDGVEYDDSGPYVARQPEIRDADGCCVALTHTPGGGWDGDLIAASPDLARALIAKCDEVDRLTRILAVERGNRDSAPMAEIRCSKCCVYHRSDVYCHCVPQHLRGRRMRHDDNWEASDV